MNRVNCFFRYVGYVSFSLLVGWFSNYSGDEADFILQIIHNIIPLLVTILAFYVTILALILKELVVFKTQKGGNIKDVLHSMKKDLMVELLLILIAFLCYVVRGAISSVISTGYMQWITVLSNSITVFTFIYFLLLIFDSIVGLWSLIEENNK